MSDNEVLYWRIRIETTVVDREWGLSEYDNDGDRVLFLKRVLLLQEDIPALLDGSSWSLEAVYR